MTHVSLPLLLEDGSRLDWPSGRYEPKVRVTLDRANIPAYHRWCALY